MTKAALEQKDKKKEEKFGLISRALFWNRRRTGRLKYDEGYEGAEHKELIKVNKDGFKAPANGQKLKPDGSLEAITKGTEIKKGEVVIIPVEKQERNRRIDKADKTNIRIRFIENVPKQGGKNKIAGAILNAHGVNSNLSISSERKKYNDAQKYNAAHPERQQIFISYDPPGYGLSGALRKSMAENAGQKIEEVTTGAMNLMALYTQAVANQNAPQEQRLGISIHAHSRSTAEAAKIAADIFQPQSTRPKYCGIEVSADIRLNSVLLDSPYTSFQKVVHDASNKMLGKKLYKKLGLPDLDTCAEVKRMMEHAPSTFKGLTVLQPRARGGELGAMSFSLYKGDGIMKHSYAEDILRSAASGLENNTQIKEKKDLLHLHMVHEATHHMKTATRIGKADALKTGEATQSHSKVIEEAKRLAKWIGFAPNHSGHGTAPSQDHKYVSVDRLQFIDGVKMDENAVSRSDIGKVQVVISSHEYTSLQRLQSNGSKRLLSTQEQEIVKRNMDGYSAVHRKVAARLQR